MFKVTPVLRHEKEPAATVYIMGTPKYLTALELTVYSEIHKEFKVETIQYEQEAQDQKELRSGS